MQKNSTVTQYLYERENPMVECMRCYEQFHQKCEEIPRKVIANKAANFFCKYAANDLANQSVRFS